MTTLVPTLTRDPLVGGHSRAACPGASASSDLHALDDVHQRNLAINRW